MEDNNNNNEKEFSIDVDKDELKEQTMDTINQVKDTFKNTDFKSGANETKGFIKNFISHPISTLDDVVNGENKYFSIGIILAICFVVSGAAYYIISTLLSAYYNKIQFKSLLLDVISPIIYILSFTISTYLFLGKDKKSISSILTGISIACSPYILINIVHIVNTLVSKVISIGFIFNIIISTLKFASFGLMFYFITELIGSKDNMDKGFRKLAIIVLVAYAIIYILQKLGIYSSI